MFDHLVFARDVLQPSEAAVLHAAWRRAIATLGISGAVSEQDRQHLAANVIKLARSGYTRTLEGTLDPADLAEAAILRFRSLSEGAKS